MKEFLNLYKTNRFLISVNNLNKTPYNSVLIYPDNNSRRIRNRILELKKHNVEYLEFSGPTRLGNIQILGKGTSAVVVKGKLRDKNVALKIQRYDSRRPSSLRESKILLHVNKFSIGPKIYSSSKNIIVMEYVSGKTFNDWFNLKHDKRIIRSRLVSLLKQCYVLDSNGIDHGELSNLNKHVIIGKTVKIIDFESASVNRKTANLTQTIQYLFVGGPPSKDLSKLFGIEDKKSLLLLLRKYKINQNHKIFHELLKKLKLNQ